MIRLKSDSYFRKVGIFFRNELANKFEVLFIISIVLFIILLCVFLGSTQMVNYNTGMTLLESIKFKGMFFGLAFLAGFVPYFYIPILSYLGYIITIANDVAMLSTKCGTFKAIALYLIPGIVELVSISLITAVGFYLCKISTKNRKYVNSSSFGLDDVKIQLYEIRKQPEKAEKMREIKKEKAEKMELNNVKTNYIQVFSYLGLILVIQLILAIIEWIIF